VAVTAIALVSATLVASPAIGTATEPGPVGFTDVTEASGTTFRHATPYSVEDYTPAMTAARMIGGAGVGDFDRDGRQDLFLVGGGLGQDALFHNLGDGTFEDVAMQAGLVGEPHLGAGVAVGDYDGDGWLDIYVTSHGDPGDPQPGHHRLYHNDGDLTFTDVSAEAGVAWTAPSAADGYGAVFGDIDLDGDLDLAVAGWEEGADGDRLFRNEGDGTFTDVTREAGIRDADVFSFSPCLLDTDGDRYPELTLVADFGTSRYYVNRGDGTFRDATQKSGTGREWSGMGTAMADLDGDGRLDWMVAAIFDAEGAGRGDGNKLYLNAGRHRWREVAAEAGVEDGGWGWGVVPVDLELDGDLDLVQTNGWDFEAYAGDTTRVWRSDGRLHFEDVAAESRLLHDLKGLSVVSFDMDNDGDQDIGITAPNDEFRLYRNDTAGAGSWLRVFLDTNGTSLPPDGIGSRVTARVGKERWSRWVGGCSNYLSTSELSAHFGLASADRVDELRVDWTDGSSTVLQDVAVSQTITVRPGD
jgi:hypothetical protein